MSNETKKCLKIGSKIRVFTFASPFSMTGKFAAFTEGIVTDITCSDVAGYEITRCVQDGVEIASRVGTHTATPTFESGCWIEEGRIVIL